MRKLGYRPEFDGIRGIAVLLVMSAHTGILSRWSSGNGLGVDMFFVLSGLLITILLLNEWHDRGGVSLRAFYGRRARRLLPALFTVVGAGALLAVTAAPANCAHVLWMAFLRISYLSNFFVAFTDSGVGVAFPHLWSLAQEEQFYLLWPPMLILLLRRHARPWHLLALLAGAIAAINLRRIGVVESGAGMRRVWGAPDTHSDAILFGCAAGIIWTHRMIRVPRLLGYLAFAVGCTAVGYLDLHVGDPSVTLFVLPLFAFASALALLSFLDHPTTTLARLVSVLPLRWLGTISYGLYLWHLPLLTAIPTPVVWFPLALGVSAISYRYIELPFRHPERARGPLARLRLRPQEQDRRGEIQSAAAFD
jgi:peptidoglycan/LPS O-acetylase OafA/YrhL